MHRFYNLNFAQVYKFLIFFLSLFLFGCGDNKDEIVWIARDASWYPLNLMGKADNLSGFTDDLMADIADREKLQIQILTTSTNDEMGGLQEGRYTGIITSMIPDSMNQQTYSFSDTFYPIGPVLVVQNSSDIKQLSDMKGKLVGIETGSLFIFNVERYPNISITPYENILFALENLSKGQIDGVIMDSIAADIYTSSFYKGRLEIASGVLTQGGLRLMVLKNTQGEDLITRFNEGLHFIQQNGKYKILLEKWSLR